MMNDAEFVKTITESRHCGKVFIGNELTRDEEELARENNLVVVFGYSDDCAEFRGAIADEVDCFDGGRVFEQSEFAQQLVRNWAKQTAETMLNLSRTKALCFDKTDMYGNVTGSTPLVGAFENAISEAVQAISSGTTDFNTAMTKTVERLGGSGVKVTYGSGVNRSLSAMIRQNILYGAKQSAQAYDEYIGEKLGCDGFEVDVHSGCRPTHEFMQGKMYSYNGEKTVDSATYEDGAEALKALSDYGCLHFKIDVILGVSTPRYSEEELEQIHKETTELIEYNGKSKTLYEWKQTQRKFERNIRTEQQKANMFEAAGMNKKTAGCKAKINAYRGAYDDMCKSVGLKPKLERMRVYKSNVDNSGKSGIIEVGSGDMIIDKFTPCLEDVKTGRIVPTTYMAASREELKNLKGWKFDWNDSSLNDADIYKLTLKNDFEAQGLIALTKFEKDRAMYVNIVESAPHNLGKNKRFNGVGGHLYAIAVQKSLESGYGGFVFMDAKNMELVKHHKETLGAVLLGRPHEYRMFIDEEAAQRLINIYNLEEE